MMIFLDTDILSYFLTGNPIICDKIQEEVDNQHQICLTCVNVYEVVKGLKYRGNKNKEQDFFKFLTNIKVFYLEEVSIQKAADIYATLRKKGVTIGDADILIASIVISNGGKFITNNSKHYSNINGLIMENWC
ncbi:MAG: type II toxin-antitoxin system VapC family toxin [Oscillospiraceae bacterium]|nr:type II toxin-antitoxin system VapC family toxin [Oscillospiraceae bacterium]